MRSSDTIFALSSGRGPAGIAVVRISGPAAAEAARDMTGAVPQPRAARLCAIRDAEGAPLDRGLVLFFPGPASATGEDVVELHLHGGRAVVAAILRTLAARRGFRPAEPGEFTRRAFSHGKMDLAEVEGLADLVAAETEAQRRQALALASGALSRRVSGWRDRLVRALMLVEAGVDFAEEEDVPGETSAPARAEAALLLDEIERALAEAGRGERVRDGLVVAIAGPPNAGKSTLLNWLAGREAAIVSPIPGTTRDVLEVHLELAGQAVTLLDTAGLRATEDAVEAEGVRRAASRAAAADVVLWLSPDDAPPPDGLAAAIPVRSKADLGGGEQGGVMVEGEPLPISCRTGAGLDDLVRLIATRADALAGGEPALLTRARQRHALAGAAVHLRRAGVASAEEFLAEDLRLAARALDEVVGRVDVEDVLDALFRTFCIGK
ncbi:tRNA uridine-5-carboxymethylaminomethyl(34) synthesis GTPase MnmE [Aquabacter spiritensis]|uniref:tRNA modification GTPase MnmE n=1 Tax=Aquabacter spiritensis TaxID=933073 RepID=A0A4R3M190_9HYPH|nr:tRNA uridine-5-carboxymethylaminomethyl(34) synthesis GTPase MnmE [Aquabacter spiritensis]TCT05939.1 tRNA modification GTPase trmE [Aquabacter spiritensis]